jgi:hypothetical protein
MENNTVHIAISLPTLTALIESGLLHAVDFRCLDADSKQTVWKLFLSALKLHSEKNYATTFTKLCSR